MSNRHHTPTNELIEAIVEDLVPVQPASRGSWTSGGLFLAISVLVSAGIFLTGPLREGIGSDLRTIRFGLECALGLAAAVFLGSAALEVGVPGSASPARLIGPGILLIASWIGLTLFGDHLFAEPGAAPTASMIGKRLHCFIESIAIAAAPMALGFLLIRRRALFYPRTRGFLIGSAAAAVSGVWMQAACMYDPGHALRFHFSALLITALVGAVVSAGFARPR